MTSTLLRAAPPPRQHNTHWWERAPCPQHPPQWWITTAQTKKLTHGNKQALTICRSCPVRQPCLDEAIDNRAVGVIQGGERMPGHTAMWTDQDKQPTRIKALLHARGLRELRRRRKPTPTAELTRRP